MSAGDDASSAPKAGAGEWIGLAVLALPTVLLALDFTVLHLALPHLAEDLRPSSTQQLWILDIYGFMIAGFLITMGTLGDRIGRRRLLMIGAMAFGAASVAAAYAPTAETLIVARALLGIAGATLMPSTLSLISNMFHDPKQRGFAIAVWLSCFSAGGAVGPMIGGVMLQWFWWGSVFLMGVPVMLLLLVLGPLLLPEYRAPEAGRLDLVSVALSLAALLPVIYGLKEIADVGWAPVPMVAIAGGVFFGWLFVRRQRRLDDPLMDLQLFRNRAFSGALIGMLLGILTLGAFVLLFAQYLQLVLDLSSVQAGLWMMPYAVANVAGAMVAPALAARMPAPYAIAGGLLLSALGYVMFGQADAASGGLTWAVVGSLLVTFGLSPLMVLTIDLIVASAPREKSGAASSMSETCSEMGMALGVATLGSVGVAVYRFLIEDSIPADVPPQAAEAARDSLASTAAVAEELPSATAAALLDASREAFLAGLSAVSYTNALVVVGLAVLVVTVLRGRQSTDETPEEPGPAAPERETATEAP